MKTNGEISFKNDSNTYKVKLLVDTGASNCFINPKVFTKDVREQINEFKLNQSANSLNLKLFDGYIQTINANAVSCCVFTDLYLKIGKWRGFQEFIISDEIENEKCILGRDFLKKNNVKIDYGRNKLTIKSNQRKSAEKFIQRF